MEKSNAAREDIDSPLWDFSYIWSFKGFDIEMASDPMDTDQSIRVKKTEVLDPAHTGNNSRFCVEPDSCQESLLTSLWSAPILSGPGCCVQEKPAFNESLGLLLPSREEHEDKDYTQTTNTNFSAKSADSTGGVCAALQDEKESINGSREMFGTRDWNSITSRCSYDGDTRCLNDSSSGLPSRKPSISTTSRHVHRERPVMSGLASKIKGWMTSRRDTAVDSLNRRASDQNFPQRRTLGGWTFRAKQYLKSPAPKTPIKLQAQASFETDLEPPVSDPPTSTVQTSDLHEAFSLQHSDSGASSITSSVVAKTPARSQCIPRSSHKTEYGRPHLNLDVPITEERGPLPFQCTFCLLQCENKENWIDHERNVHMWRPRSSHQPILAADYSGASREWLEAKRDWFWNCGFCGILLQSWDERQTHFIEHFEDKKTMASWNPLQTPYPLDKFLLTPIIGFPQWSPAPLLSNQEARIRDFVNFAFDPRLPWCKACKIPLTNCNTYEEHIKQWHSPPIAWRCLNLEHAERPGLFFETVDESRIDTTSIQEHPLVPETFSGTTVNGSSDGDATCSSHHSGCSKSAFITMEDEFPAVRSYEYCLLCENIFHSNSTDLEEEHKRHLRETHNLDETKRGPKFFNEGQFLLHLANGHCVTLAHLATLAEHSSQKNRALANWTPTDFI
ncbi:hypothetical protein PABG_03254 [Paracoccidioides brasiliensis Pb03]|nr:hypothetical protein PABG_03254 [Paracoccidioides brasiliensis Pb03]